MAELRVEIARSADMPDVLALYAEGGYTGGVASADRVFVARLGSELAGAVRLCPEGGTTMLRGMQVRARYQRMGVGRALLRACVPFLDAGVAYCLPYTHLVAFYEAAGFRVAGVDEIPEFLRRRLEGYLAEGQRLLAMRRGPGADGAS
ncbi:N-acetyltransferase [Oxalobacteraceae bacterium OM1]|nr:N-acetyltransferase [Oxalobacteraceae bacterium OM1]